MITRHLLWSGGWDSTFRLLYILLVRGEAVQPHYIINIKRNSFAKEIRTQVRVRERLQAEHPAAASRLLPTLLDERYALPVDPILHEQYYRIINVNPMGEQYEWLAYYANQLGLDTRQHPLELGIIAGGNFVHQFGSALEIVDVHGEAQYRFRQVTENPDLQMFRFFSMPTLTYTKVQLGEMSTAFGFSDLHHESWFCHKPMFRDIPCGVCQPCRDARRKGMSYRLHPLSNLRFSFSRWVVRPVKTALQIAPYDRWQPKFHD